MSNNEKTVSYTQPYPTATFLQYDADMAVDGGGAFSEGEKLTITRAIIVDGQVEELLAQSADGKSKDWVLAHEIELDGELPKVSESESAEDLEESDAEEVIEESPALPEQPEEEAPKAVTKKTTAKKTAKKATKKVVDAEEVIEESPALPEIPSDDAGDVIEDTAEDTEEVHGVLANTSTAIKAMDTAKALVERIDTTYFTLGGVLAEIHKNHWFEHRTNADGKKVYGGRDAFADYVLAELGIHYRKAMYLIQINTYFTALGYDEAVLRQVGGWSKAKEIAQLGNTDGDFSKEDIDELVKFASQNTREELQGKIRTEFTNTLTAEELQEQRDSKTKYTSYKFHVVGSQTTTIDEMVEAVSAITGETDFSKAVTYVIQEWLMMTQGESASLADSLAVLEARHGIKLGVIEDEDASVESHDDDSYDETEIDA